MCLIRTILLSIAATVAFSAWASRERQNPTLTFQSSIALRETWVNVKAPLSFAGSDLYSANVTHASITVPIEGYLSGGDEEEEEEGHRVYPITGDPRFPADAHIMVNYKPFAKEEVSLCIEQFLVDWDLINVDEVETGNAL